MAKQRTLEARQEDAEKILVKMNEQSVSLADVLKNANAILGKIDKKDKEYERLNNILKSINTTTKAAIKSFEAHKKNIAVKLSEANKFYDEKYVPLAKKINDPAKGLSATLKTTEKDYDTYKINKEKCLEKFQEITNIAKDSRFKSKELANIERAIVKFHSKAEVSTTKIGDLLSGAEATNNKINQIHADIVAFRKTGSASANNIKIFENDSQILKSQISEYHGTASEKLRDIERIYGIAHETGLSGEFEKRRNDLNKEIKKWKRWIIWTSSILWGGVVGFYIMQLCLYDWDVETAFDLNFYVRFLIFSPLVYYLYFVSTQYNKTQKLHDKYAFKTTLAMVIKSHIELLTKQGYFEKEEQCDKILDFVLAGFGKIYNEPYIDDSYKMKIKLANFEVDMQKRIIDKLSEITGYEHSNGAVQAVFENKNE
ncbi:MAG: hypothetical protein LBV47_00680 [Bacteroidales bacterium]|jgi:hypothetical protein|nr:hypothetical protein [Bacteroidales bacterium]